MEAKPYDLSTGLKLCCFNGLSHGDMSCDLTVLVRRGNLSYLEFFFKFF